ncbi:MAG TPA: LLM class flavin-dependent oxidoreductase [Candidatus Dormibacteraeota bacterium]|jgi:5,10-methylenetetrahydromethanopterin reductase
MLFGLAFLGDEDSRGVIQWARDLERHENLSRLWVADEHFLRDPWVQLGAIGAVTTRVSIGICITDPYIRHPALTAAAAATLQELSGGRALLGLGAGSTGFAALGLTPRLPAQAVTECIELCRRMWNEPKAFSYQGKQIQFLDDCLDFKPSAAIPIYVAARGPKMLAVAARLADAVLIGSFVQGLGLDYALKSIHEAEASRDKALPPLRKACWIYLSVGPDSTAARRGAARGLALALRSSRKMLTEIGYTIPADVLDFVEKSRHAWDADEVDWVVARLSQELIEDLTVAGDPTECVAKLRKLKGRGIEEVAILPFAPAGGNVEDMVELLFTKVAPALAA